MKDPEIKDIFYIKFNTKNKLGELEEKEASWIPANHKPVIHSDTVLRLEARGNAVVKVACIFPSFVPTQVAYAGRLKEEAVWYGDLAKTIFANL